MDGGLQKNYFEMASSYLSVVVSKPRDRFQHRKNALKLNKLCIKLQETEFPCYFKIRIKEIAKFMKNNLFQDEFCGSWVVVRGLLAECFLRQLDDSDIIGNIMTCLKTDDLRAILPFVQNAMTFQEIEFPSLDGQTTEKKGLRSACFACYIFHHVNKGRVLLDGERFISLAGLNTDTECTAARIVIGGQYFNSSACAVSPLLLMLQYGARLCDRRKVSPDYVPAIVTDTLCKIIKLGVDGNLWDGSLKFHAEPLRMLAEITELCGCFLLLLKETTNPHEVTFYLAGQTGILRKIPELDVLIPFYDKVFPNRLYGRNMPASLRHMCRFAIRKILYDSWNLPDGIESLPIPTSLREYLDLEEDI